MRGAMSGASPPVLLVEDDSNDVILLRRAFRKANLCDPICSVEDGEEAVGYLSGEGVYADRVRFPLPALMLLDLKLPRMSGCEVLKWLRAQPELRRLPVIMLTSSCDHADVNEAYDLGANSYLVKPTEPQALAELVQTVHSYWIAMNRPPEVSPGGQPLPWRAAPARADAKRC